MREKRVTGFSIAEGLVSLALILLVTGVVASLVARSSHLLRFSDAQSKRLEILTFCFNTIRAEVESSLEITEPSSTSPSASLDLVQVAPDYAFPEPVYPSPVDWDWSAIETIAVRYALDGDALARTVNSEARTMAQGLDDFTAQLTPEGNVQVTVSILQEGGARSFSLVALKP